MRKFLQRILLPIVAGAPSGPVNGEIWYDSVAGKITVRQGAATRTFVPESTMLGTMVDFAGPRRSVPAGWLLCYGQSISRATYATLFDVLCPKIGTTCTLTAASDLITTTVAHDLVVGDVVIFEGGGGGLNDNGPYYVQSTPSTTTFKVSATRTVTGSTGAITPGSVVDITLDMGGIVVRHAPFGITSSTTFKLPDYRGKASIGNENMDGAGTTNVNGWSHAIGFSAGEGTHTLSAAESGQPGFSSTTGSNSVNHGHTYSGSGSTGGRSAFHQHTQVKTDVTSASNTTTGGTGVRLNGATQPVINTGNDNTDHGHSFSWSGTTNDNNANHTHPFSIAAAPASTAHNTIGPSISANKIIFVGT